MNAANKNLDFYRLNNSISDAFYPLLMDSYTSMPFYIVSLGKTNHNVTMKRPGFTYSVKNTEIRSSSGYLHYMFLYSVKGEGRVFLGHNEIAVPSGTMIFYSPGTPYNYEPVVEPWETRWIVFNGYAVKKLLPFKCGVYPVTNTKKSENLFNRIFECFQDSNWESTSSYLLYETLLHSIGDFLSCNQANTKKKRLEPIIEYLDENYSKDISLGDIADFAGVSKTHLCRLFQDAYKIRPFEYLTQIRIKKAKEMMQMYPKMLTSEISDFVGFKSHSYFTMLFKKSENITPTEFRNMFF